MLIVLIDGTHCGDAECTPPHESFKIEYDEKADSNKQEKTGMLFFKMFLLATKWAAYVVLKKKKMFKQLELNGCKRTPFGFGGCVKASLSVLTLHPSLADICYPQLGIATKDQHFSDYSGDLLPLIFLEILLNSGHN